MNTPCPMCRKQLPDPRESPNIPRALVCGGCSTPVFWLAGPRDDRWALDKVKAAANAVKAAEAAAADVRTQANKAASVAADAKRIADEREAIATDAERVLADAKAAHAEAVKAGNDVALPPLPEAPADDSVAG